ncbi:MAG: hypothetical protein UU13_C0003G0040 [Candidatus Nomurabacteria bacterium GW2011_GWB1_40_7]|uniref:Uncharacterized protein n=1 Tax=Candidatus Nomurabacteria bacterium GW2011_GWB1_40_7 TaxID=1618744 RepID=A0A0G0T790_9BACT|nr:MAG: hypothetical protein UU13_C0003G0040 [Candidatus Nomurabacteria bacterium GW2011_GWB1_40_7]
MWVTVKKAEALKGGTVEIIFPKKSCLFLGNVGEIKVSPDGEFQAEITLSEHVQFKGEREDFSPISSEYIMGRQFKQLIDLNIYSANNIGPDSNQEGGGDRLCLSSPDKSQIIIFHPANDARMEECTFTHPRSQNR